MTSSPAALPVDATGDEGFSLIEVLLSVVIMGLAFVAILGSMGTSIIASDVHRTQTDVQAVLVSAGERITSRDLVYEACATVTNANYLTAARDVPVPSGWDADTAITISSIKYETRDSSGASFQSTCYDANDIKVQEITLTVTSPDGDASSSLAVLKNGNV